MFIMFKDINVKFEMEIIIIIIIKKDIVNLNKNQIF